MNPQEEQSFKKKREQFSISIRKNHRENLISKRRNLQQMNQIQEESDPTKKTQKLIIVDQSIRSYLVEIMKQKYQTHHLHTYIELMNSRDILQKHRAVIALRSISNHISEEQVAHLLNFNVIDLLVTWYTQTDYPQIKLESLWIFTNLSSFSRDISDRLVGKKIIPVMCEDLMNSSQPIQYQAVWAIGNIAADDPKYRDELISLGAIIKIIKFLQSKRTNNQIVTAVWALSNLARGQPAPKYDLVKYVIPPIAEALKSDIIKNQQVVSDCLWTLANLSEGPKLRLQRILQTDVLPKIMRYLRHSNLIILIPSLRLIGNFSSGTKQHTNQILKLGFLDEALRLLDSPKNLIIKQTCWAISNVTAGTDEQILQFLQRQDLIQKLMTIYPNQIPDIKTEIIWIFTNLQRCSVPDQILKVFEAVKIVSMIGEQLKEKQERCLFDGLTCLYRILALADRCGGKKRQSNPLVTQLVTLGYAPVLESLQKNQSDKIFRECQKIMERFFDVLEEDQMRDV